jgi:hypothetical protein
MPPRCLRSAFVLLLCLASTPAAFAASTLSFNSTSGDPVGQGQVATWSAPTATFTASNLSRESVTVQVNNGGQWFALEFAAPRGQELVPGMYYGSERADDRTGRAPGLDVSSSNASCNDTWGSFAIRQIAFDELNHLTSLEVTYNQRCNSSTAPLLSGTLTWNAGPLYLSAVSAAGDPVGGGVGHLHYGSTSDLALHGTAAGLSYAVSGLRQNVYMAISPRTGTSIAAGMFPIARGPTASAVGVYLTSNLVACNTVSGTLVIRTVTFGTDGHPTGLDASITAYCNGAAVPFKATIHQNL